MTNLLAKMLSRQIILLFLIAVFAIAFGDEFLDENNLYFDFPYKTAKNWTGLEGWKFVANNRSGMFLNGPPDTGENYPVLVLASENGTSATLTSPLLSVRDDVSCLHFNYHIRVQNNADYGLIVSSVKEDGDKTKLWAMSRQDYDIWESAQIQIKRDVPIKIQFSGNQNLDGVIGLNKFYLHDGKCENANDIDCDFESDCASDWSIDSYSNLARTNIVSKSGEQEYFDVKHEDHTTDSIFGHTAIIAPKARYTAKYRSPIQHKHTGKCLSFAYMTNSKDMYLYLGRYDSEYSKWYYEWKAKYNYYMLNEWHYIQVPDEYTSTSRYEFWVDNNGYTESTAIQIDDVKLLSECKPEFDNDFRYGLGLWRSPKSSLHRFRIGKGRVENRTIATNMPANPIGAYTDFTTTPYGSTMKLLSAWSYDDNVAKCVAFDFLVHNFTSSSKFNLNLIDEYGTQTTLWSYNTNSYTDGHVYENEPVQIQRSTAYYNHRLEFYVETDNPQMSVAIIKIVVSHWYYGDCKK